MVFVRIMFFIIVNMYIFLIWSERCEFGSLWRWIGKQCRWFWQHHKKIKAIRTRNSQWRGGWFRHENYTQKSTSVDYRLKGSRNLRKKLCVIASLPGGVSDVEFSLIGSGPGSNTAKIMYSWPPIVYDIPGIFKKDIDAKLITSCHPLIISLKNELKTTVIPPTPPLKAR
jgi:hypothetical protein